MITVKKLDFKYANSGKHAVNDMSFEIGRGEIFGFLGPSGAGKTTVQRLIIGLLRNYGGSIEVMGKERKHWNKDFFESIGVAFDFPNLFL
jgi:fluoroquinolone transport system ATP-binding protein